MNLTLIAAAISAVIAFGSAWQIQSRRADSKEKERVEQALREKEDLRILENRRNSVAVSERDAATRRDAELRAAADGSRAALVGLSHAAEQALREAGSSHSACIARTATATRLLNQCGAAYQDLGERADRHVSDLKTLIGVWPK